MILATMNLILNYYLSLIVITKGVTMDSLFSLNERNPAGYKFISSIWRIENKILKKKISRQNRIGGCTFSAISKRQKSTSKFWKIPETKKMRNKTFKNSKLLLFFKKIKVNMVKNVQTATNTQFPHSNAENQS